MKFASCDPGESTGYAVWDGRDLLEAGTASLADFKHALGVALGVESPGHREIDEELVRRLRGIRCVVMEDWSLYPWKLDTLAWDKCRTARLIGALEFICEASNIPYVQQPAAIKDASEAAGAADLFLSPQHENRHANDAIRHGMYFLLTQPQRALAGKDGG